MPLRAHLHNIPPIEINAHVYEAMDRFREAGSQRFLPVVHADGSVAGVLRDDSLKGFLFGMYGYQLVKHHPLRDFISPSVTIPIEANIETALSLYSSKPNQDGLIIVEDGLYVGVLLTGALLTMYEENRLRIQRQLLQSQKMEAIGTMAGGIAHDFNNILMPIMGYAELIGTVGPTTASIQIPHYADQILQATRRARDLVEQILSFSRQQEQADRQFPLGTLIKEVTKLLRASMPSTIHIRHSLVTSRDSINADPTRIHQVLMNLCTNAAYAMKDQGGTLEITLVDHSGPIEELQSLEATAMEGYLCLSVRDTGSGIEPRIAERIFEPFFTTKPLGEGTGMGLAVVHGIVKSLHGHISCESRLGEGSCFRLYLPRAEGTGLATTPEPRIAEQQQGRGQRILIVDDEAVITELVEEVLTRQGYRTESRTSSLAALQLLEQDPLGFDLVLTDQTMPLMTGIELSKRMLAIRPDLPIILFTGFSEQLSASAAMAMGVRAFLRKPVSFAELLKTTHALLDGA